MINNTIFKGYIKKINEELEIKKEEVIFFRIINIENKIFFAEEISTGAIFPIYYFSDNFISSFSTHSHVKAGKYFVYCGVTPKDKPLNLY